MNTNAVIRRRNRRIACPGLRRSALALAIAATATLTACAPVQQGNQHCHPINAFITQKKDEALIPALSQSTLDKVDALVQEKMLSAQNADVPGCGVAITIGTQIAALRTYGVRDLTSQEPFTLGTLSGIGSVSKTYTALAALRLMEMNKMSLLGNAVQYLEDYGNEVPWADALVEDLLAHKGGLRWNPHWDPATFDDAQGMHLYWGGVSYPQLKPRYVLAGIAEVASNSIHPIGAQPHYSNTGYTIAGAVIDEITQQLAEDKRGYENFVWNEIGRGNASNEPASPAMCLGADVREAMVDTLATGYNKEGGRANFSDSDWSGWGWAGPAGGWWVTTGDLARLMITLQSDAAVARVNIDSHMRFDHGELFPEETEEESYVDSVHTGLGLELSPPQASRKWYGKSGGIAGYSSHVRIWPDSQHPEKSIGVAMMCNRSGVGTGMIDEVRDIVANEIGGLAGGGFNTGSKNPVPQVRDVVSRYVANGRVDADAALRLMRDTAQQPDGRAILDAIARDDYETAYALIARRYPAGRGTRN